MSRSGQGALTVEVPVRDGRAGSKRLAGGACSVESCGVKIFAKGLCQRHYQRAFYAAHRGRGAKTRYRCANCGEMGHRAGACVWPTGPTRLCTSCERWLPNDEAHFMRAGGHLRNRCRTCNAVLRYGINGAQYDALVQLAEGRCAMCGEAGELVVDHDHGNGRVRGLIHQRCNTLLGLVEATPRLVRLAEAYLARREAQGVA